MEGNCVIKSLKEKAIGKLDQDLLDIPQCRSSVYMNPFLKTGLGHKNVTSVNLMDKEKNVYFLVF